MEEESNVAVTVGTPSPVLPPAPPEGESASATAVGDISAELLDPVWWRLGTVPLVALVLAAAAGDLLCPSLASHWGYGVGGGIGVLCWAVAVLALRRDFSHGEQWFLSALGCLSFSALLVSGSSFALFVFLLGSFVVTLCPSEFLVPGGRKYRTWWGFWFASRRTRGYAGKVRRLLPLLLSLVIGFVAFVFFLSIFASGNPVVLRVWKFVVDTWNSLAGMLRISWDLWIHALLWGVGVALFGLVTMARPFIRKKEASVPPVKERGVSALPYAPLMILLGINLAFLIANSTDVLYLWRRVIPEGISQTTYLYEGASSIIWASALASAVLVFFFRRSGNARRGRVSRAAGYVLVIQTFLLAASVYVRLYYQIDDLGFTPRRVGAAEFLVFGVVGLVVLLSYMGRSGNFLKFGRLFLGVSVLLLVALCVNPPSKLAGDLNLRYAGSHPQWSFSPSDFGHGRFNVESNLEFADFVNRQYCNRLQRNVMEPQLVRAAQKVESRASLEGWTHWTLSLWRDVPVAERILGRPILARPVERED